MQGVGCWVNSKLLQTSNFKPACRQAGIIYQISSCPLMHQSCPLITFYEHPLTLCGACRIFSKKGGTYAKSKRYCIDKYPTDTGSR